MTDQSGIYRRISRINHGIYTHSVVDHRTHFIHPTDPEIHTQHIESMWMRAKRKIKYQCGSRHGKLQSRLDEFVWREEFKNNYFANVFIGIAVEWPVIQSQLCHHYNKTTKLFLSCYGTSIVKICQVLLLNIFNIIVMSLSQNNLFI